MVGWIWTPKPASGRCLGLMRLRDDASELNYGELRTGTAMCASAQTVLTATSSEAPSAQ